MTVKSRSPLAIIYSALAFGIVLTPYSNIAFGELRMFTELQAGIFLLFLISCTTVLFFGLVAPLKRANQHCRVPRTIVFLAFLCSCFIVYLLFFAPPDEQIQRYFHLVQFVGCLSALVLFAAVFLRPSLLEKWLTAQFNQSRARRAGATVLLLFVLASAACTVYQYRQFESQSAGG